MAIVANITAIRTLADLVERLGSDALDGGTVLPGFRLPLDELFSELDRRR